MDSWRRLLRYLRPYRTLFGASIVFAVAASLLDGLTFALLIPFLRLLFGAGDALDAAPTAVERVLNLMFAPVLNSPPGQALLLVALVITGAVALKGLAGYLAAASGVTVRERVVRDLRLELYSHLQRLSLAWHQRVKGGQVLSRVLADTDSLRFAVSGSLSMVAQQAAVVLVYLAILFAISWRLALVTLILAPSIALMMRPILRRIRARAAEAMDARGEMTAAVSEASAGVRAVKAHGAEACERRRFAGVVDSYLRNLLRAERYALLAGPLSETVGAAVIVILLIAGADAAAAGEGMRPELFVTFLAVTLRMLSPVKKLAQFPATAQQSMAAASRIFEVLDREPEDLDAPGARELPGFEREIAFRDVWVAHHPGSWVLQDVNLVVGKGEIVAIVGPSGAGKSTLVDLLPRFMEPVRGSVEIDGQPVSTFTRRSLRRAVGIVSQEAVLFHDTVRANIAYGNQENVGIEAVEAAARAANAHDFIMRLPFGYDTILGERGSRLSGGERQRIALARVLLRDPPILILDEATSALDAESERLVQDAIARLLERRTVMIIAHRMSTVMMADRIVVMEAGRVAEQGTHDELIVAGGLYQRLRDLELVG